MALSTVALAIFWVTIVFLPDQYSAQVISVHVNSSCPAYQTQCGLGCCPFADGVCCDDGFECCQHGQTCIPFIGICIGLKDGIALLSKKSTPVENLITACPPGTTTCGMDKCCRYPQATCCSDGDHCCPHDYRCDIPGKRCIRNSFNSLTSGSSAMAVLPAAKAVKKSPYKSCPGTDKICPSYSSCCIADNGQWSCCPNPSLGLLGVGGGECCDTIFGHMCCPDDFPHCTIFGCTQ